MKLLLINLFIMCTGITFAQEDKQLTEKIIALEKAALERWNNGDPMGYLELSANDVTYFDPFLSDRSNGKANLEKLYLPIKGQVKVDKYKIKNPQVQSAGKLAVLTFNLNSYVQGKLQKWNCTEVFRNEPDGSWKIIHTHWSLTKPELK